MSYYFNVNKCDEICDVKSTCMHVNCMNLRRTDNVDLLMFSIAVTCKSGEVLCFVHQVQYSMASTPICSVVRFQRLHGQITG